MTTSAPTRSARLAADVAKALTLSDGARALLAPAHTPRQFFDVLAAQPPLAEDATHQRLPCSIEMKCCARAVKPWHRPEAGATVGALWRPLNEKPRISRVWSKSASWRSSASFGDLRRPSEVYFPHTPAPFAQRSTWNVRTR